MRVNIGIGILAAMSLVCVSLSAAQAQGPAGNKTGKPGEKGGQPGAPGRGRRSGGMMRDPKIIKELGITEAQKKQLGAIMEKTSAKRKAIRDDKTMTEDQKKAKMRELGKETTTAYEKILTPEQNTKIKAMRKKAMDERMAKGGGIPDRSKVGAKP